MLPLASPRSSDQAQHLARLLAPLSPPDRELVVEMVEKLVTRLAAH